VAANVVLFNCEGESNGALPNLLAGLEEPLRDGGEGKKMGKRGREKTPPEYMFTHGPMTARAKWSD